MEGVNHEAVGLAGHLKLGRLIVLWDDNSITIDGSTELSRNEDVVARHQAAEWHTLRMRRARCRQGRQGDRGGDRRPAAEPDPLQDDHRLWRAPQAGHGGDPRRGARRGRSRRGAQSSWAGTCRRSKFPTMCSTAWREVGASAARRPCASGRERLEASGQQGRVPGADRRASRTTAGSSPISTSCSPI